MYQFIWGNSFIKAYKKVTKNNAYLKNKINTTLKILQENPFDNKLKTHKLHGFLSNLHSASINYEFRIIFALREIEGVESIILIDIGTHDEVY